MIFRGIEKRLDLILDELIKMNCILDIIAQPEVRDGRYSNTALVRAEQYLEYIKKKRGNDGL